MAQLEITHLASSKPDEIESSPKRGCIYQLQATPTSRMVDAAKCESYGMPLVCAEAEASITCSCFDLFRCLIIACMDEVQAGSRHVSLDRKDRVQ